jgi:hypothetical protein
VRCAAGLGNVDLYTATRHYFGWYAWNVLELDARDIALHFGHRDGGELVRKLYGHPDAKLARERVREAFRLAPPRPHHSSLRVADSDDFAESALRDECPFDSRDDVQVRDYPGNLEDPFDDRRSPKHDIELAIELNGVFLRLQE